MNIRHLVCSNICSLENLFKVFLVFPVCTFLQTSELVFTVICGILFAKCDVPCGELTSSFGKVHSASPVCSFVFLCNDMQEPGLMLGTHVLWICSWFYVICGREFKAFFTFEMVCAVRFPPPAWDCVLRCECDFWFLFLFQWIFCSLNLPLPPFYCQYFYFFNL